MGCIGNNCCKNLCLFCLNFRLISEAKTMISYGKRMVDASKKATGGCGSDTASVPPIRSAAEASRA